ncbi:MAG TPA: hypothetical protein PKM12_08605 [Marmoricola sp.]|nr:hypothetical protein [Marmoricola sp.]
MSSSALDQLQRWEDAGGTWQVRSRTTRSVVLSLRRCDGGEEVDQINSSDSELLAYLGERMSSEE